MKINTHPDNAHNQNQITFISIGPKGSLLTRTKNNQKIINFNGEEQPLKIPQWNNTQNLQYSPNLNDLPQDQPLAILTGKSNIIVLDFDDETFYKAIEINDNLPDYLQCTCISQSIGKVGGHFIYKYEPNELTAYIDNPNGKKQNKIDTLYGNTLVFWSNQANQTKQLLHYEPNQPLIPMPLAMQMLIIAEYSKNNKPITQTTQQIIQGSKLALLASRALKDKKAMEILLHIITPQRYKHILEQSRKDLYPNHPDRLPDTESAHLYLVALAGVLLLDESIDHKLYQELIYSINSLFSSPLDDKRVQTIVEHDLHSGKFKYDPQWKEKSLTIITTKNEPLEVFMIINKGAINYIIANQYTQDIKVLASASAVIDYILSQAKTKIQKEKLATLSIYVNPIDTPQRPYGFDYKDNTFNNYRWNEQQKALYDPEQYQARWKLEEQNLPYDDKHPHWPTITLKALESAIGPQLYTHFLPFIKRKFTTFQHSPLFFVLLGVPHSFKSGLVNGVIAKLCPQRYKHLSLELMLDKYNDWQLNTDTILLDEVHYFNQNELKQLIKTINEITGNDTITGVRRMFAGVDTSVNANTMTFFLTTNEPVKVTNEINDRRMVVFKSTEKLSDALNMDPNDIYDAITNESVDFAYYLATQVQAIDIKDYVTNTNWKQEEYNAFQQQNLKLDDKLLKAIDDNNFEDFINVCKDLNISMTKIIESTTFSKGSYFIRLFNSNVIKAKIPALLQDIELGYQFKKKLYLTKNTSNNVSEYDNNNRYVGNKRTTYNIKFPPKWFKDMFAKHNMLDTNNIEGIDL